MKHLILNIFICLCFISCENNNQTKEKSLSVDEIIIPSTEQNKKDGKFKLNNGVLFFDDQPYSGIVKEFYPDECLKSTSEYYQGKRQGIFLGFYSNGKKWFERYYTKGVKTGTHKGWYQNGQQMFEYQLNENGVYNGSLKDWHINGQLAKHFNFMNGKEEGSQRMWQGNGKIRANFYTVNGDRHGLIGLKNCESVATNEDN